MPEDLKIEAIVSLHEWSVAKDKRIAELESRCDATVNQNVVLLAQVAELERQLTEAKEDTADLDWLEEFAIGALAIA